MILAEVEVCDPNVLVFELPTGEIAAVSLEGDALVVSEALGRRPGVFDEGLMVTVATKVSIVV